MMKPHARRALLSAAALCICAGCQRSDQQLAQLRVAVETALKDPSSAQYRGDRVITHDDGRVYYCGEVNARNAFGGYVGFQKFIAGEGTVVILSPSDGPRIVAAFEQFWRTNCA